MRRLIPQARVGEPSTRHRLLISVILVAVMALSGRLIWVQGLDASARAEEAIAQRTVTRTIPALRGEITDRHGTVLASSVERYDLWVNQLQVDEYLENSTTAEVTGVEAAARDLAPVLGWSVSKTEEALTGDAGFSYLRKNVEPEVRDAAIALRIPGIGADRVADRLYPAGSVGGNILGFVGADGTALAGTELSFDEELRGTDGKTTYERGAQGQIIPTGKQETTAAVDGSDVVLTIDRDLQWKAQQIVAGAVEQWGAAGGSAVVYNARTGEVLSLAEYPSYDPNSPGESDPEDLGNRSISSVFEPGSTGKVFTLAAALEEGTVTPESEYEIPYEDWFDGHRIKDSHQHPDQQLTLAGVLKHSSNVGTVQISETLSPEVRYDYLKAFGLGERTGVELPAESAGVVHPASQWTGRTRYTTAFGQGYSVNALQMVSAIGTFANDGVRVEPSLIAGTRQDDGSVRPLGEPESTRVVSSETAQTMRALMDNSVDDETSSAAVTGYAVGGKTGTAQVGDGTYTASFIGFAPADDPELVVGVFIFGLNSFISGSRSAAPAFSELTTFALQNQGIAPTGEPGRELENEW
ncbi:cell division protein FtsI/penicillin-binding protein 2 [Brachybacterium faecium DSM 4810]|uniref:Cell division protein FtsI/penicillin-binding protein 2 n=1 Tax=Brachybacterium faecium (strain ATCC 43885 / DSM 4810 / JCM 11609 / LMG 19847 / NBRC 14762 / NCIMB 9860 / 6-10) TaxID=446465 RepID=C7MBF0_BRAFD|nr:cell division protein FtsI/penicillin-binding protein 2 [Brachybacterium faecium DSM 4810]